MTEFTDAISNIKTLVEYKNHTGAYMRSAVLLGEDEIQSTLVEIDERSGMSGEISSTDYELRHELYLKLKESAKTKLSASEYEDWYNAL